MLPINRSCEQACLWCGRKLEDQEDLLRSFYHPDLICDKCRKEMKYRPLTITKEGLKIEMLYPYSNLGREMLIQYKELGDEALFPLFLHLNKDKLRHKYRKYTLVPLPSSLEAYKRRGFNQVNEIFSVLELPICELLEKEDVPEQKHLNRLQRYQASRKIRLIPGKQIPKTPILLVDDLITTGYSIMASFQCFKGTNPQIQALCVFGHHFYYENASKIEKLGFFLND